MATELRNVYEKLADLSTATHQRMCNELLDGLTATKGASLADWFVDAINANSCFEQIGVPFIPVGRESKVGRNPVVKVMSKASPLSVATPDGRGYEFSFLQREVPHLRARTKQEQEAKAWIDYIARCDDQPILGEIKWKDDENPFYAFIQLLTYLSEMATKNQIERAIRQSLFGADLERIDSFDLHIFLSNFNDRGEKGKLIEPTHQLATAFKHCLGSRRPDFAALLGNVLCISSLIDEGQDSFAKLECLWMV
jgi:hypothetical protein